jgi:hypothetical protein
VSLQAGDEPQMTGYSRLVLGVGVALAMGWGSGALDATSDNGALGHESQDPGGSGAAMRTGRASHHPPDAAGAQQGSDVWAGSERADLPEAGSRVRAETASSAALPGLGRPLDSATQGPSPAPSIALGAQPVAGEQDGDWLSAVLLSVGVSLLVGVALWLLVIRRHWRLTEWLRLQSKDLEVAAVGRPLGDANRPRASDAAIVARNPAPAIQTVARTEATTAVHAKDRRPVTHARVSHPDPAVDPADKQPLEQVLSRDSQPPVRDTNAPRAQSVEQSPREATAAALPRAEVFTIGKRGENTLGDDVVLINYDLAQNRLICVVADGATEGNAAVGARNMSVLVASGCIDILTKLYTGDMDSKMILEFVQSALPKYVSERLPNPNLDGLEDGAILRTCAFVAAIATPTRLCTAGSGDCYAIARRRQSVRSEQESSKPDEGSADGIGVIALKKDSKLHIRIASPFCSDVSDPDTAYLCTDGAYGAFLSAYQKDPVIVDEAQLAQIADRMLDRQKLGTYANDDIAMVRLRFR